MLINPHDEKCEPLVSVIIPTKNRCSLLERAIKSVLVQNYDNIEIIIIDEASDDATSEIAYRYKQRFKKFKYMRNDKSYGGAKARNIGISFASGRYIAFLDDDDEWLPTKITKQVNKLENDYSVGLVFCWFLRRYNNGIIERVKQTNQVDFLRLLWTNIGSCSFCVVRSDLVKKIGGFDETLLSCQDWDLWLRLSNITKIYGIREYLVIYNDHSMHRISTNEINRIRGYQAFYLKYSNSMTHLCRRYHLAFIYYLKFRFLEKQKINNLYKMFYYCPSQKIIFFILVIIKNILPKPILYLMIYLKNKGLNLTRL